MSMFTLTCPHCGFSKDLILSSIPPIGTSVTCPKCQGQFAFQKKQAEASQTTSDDLPIVDTPPEDSQFPPPLPPKLSPHPSARTAARPQTQTREVEKRKSTGFKVGLLLAAIHLCLAVLAFLAAIKSHSSTAGLVFIWFFFLDAPLLLLLPPTLFNIFGIASPLIQYGVIGSALWFLIPWLIDKAVTRISPNTSRTARVLILIGVIPFILGGFYRLSFFSTKLLVQRERPAELKKMLNSATSDFLTGKVVFEDYAPMGVRSISRMNCRPGIGAELLLALPRGLVFLNENYQEQYRLNLSERKAYQTIQPLYLDGSCVFLAHMFQEGMHLFGLDEKEIWRDSPLVTGAKGAEGVRFGDVDGDGKPEFAIYSRYTEGVHLIDGNGKTRWKHPAYTIGHLEMQDVNGDGKAEIIYTNSNNANGITEFTTLDAMGTELNQQKITTASYEFALVNWPISEGKPNFLLTEDGKIKLVDLQGATVMTLDAPGCKTFGNLSAITVRFKKDEPAYLAVKKSIHPDLSVLYVYDANSKLVFQKTQAVEGLLAPTLAAVPVRDSGAEKLLVGEYTKGFKAQVLEYSLTR